MSKSSQQWEQLQMFGWKPCAPVHWSWRSENEVKKPRKQRASGDNAPPVQQKRVDLSPGALGF